MSLEIRPIVLRKANAAIVRWHRHHDVARGCVFCVSVWAADRMVGVAIVARPGARMLQDGHTAEVTRVATDGTANASSKLYGACKRAARALGYRRLITYTLESEDGASVKASGFRRVTVSPGGSWDRPSRRRGEQMGMLEVRRPSPEEPKVRWEIDLIDARGTR